jgi:carboxymethylenebutenolidase
MSDQPNYRYLAMPPSGRGPGVLVLHAWWGLTDFFRGFCDRLAQTGFVVLAPDLFAGKTARTIEEAEMLVSGMEKDPGQVAKVILSATAELRHHPAITGNGLGVVGFSFGAFWALWLSKTMPEEIRAVTVFYGTGESEFQESQAVYQGHFAENDPYEPASNVKFLEESLKAANRTSSLLMYPGTGHWFFESDRPDAYNEAAARLAWDRTVTFMHEQLDRKSS